ncbi:hypothetical protein ACHAPO_008616 [Fusarium lateritium]
MASQFHHNTSNLFRLPAELLIEIFKQLRFVKVLLTDEYPHLYIRHDAPGASLYRDTRIVKETYQDLKSLRLAHKTFAEFPDLSNILFSNIVLQPTRTALTSLQRSDFSRVAQYVRSVTFATPPSWALLYKAYVENHRNSQGSSKPFSLENLGSCYEAYMCDARDTYALLKDPEEILKVLGDRIEKVKLLSYACERIRQVKYLDALNKVNTGIPWQLPRHGHANEWSIFGFRKEHANPTVDYFSKHATAVTGDKLIATVFTCLAASGVAIPNLNIQLLMTGNIECKDIPGWEDLDFSKLKVLHISPEIPTSDIRVLERYTWADKMKIKCGNFCHDLLDKCHSNIQHFAYGIDHTGRGVLSWPTRRPTHDFPELTHLTQKANTSPLVLAEWLLHLQNLNRLDLSGDFCQGSLPVDWCYVFSAIGKHPNVSGETPKGLRVDIDELYMIRDELSYSGVVCKDVNIATKRHGRDTSLKHWEDVNYGIEACIYDDVPLHENKALSYIMGYWYPRGR